MELEDMNRKEIAAINIEDLLGAAIKEIHSWFNRESKVTIVIRTPNDDEAEFLVSNEDAKGNYKELIESIKRSAAREAEFYMEKSK